MRGSTVDQLLAAQRRIAELERECAQLRAERDESRAETAQLQQNLCAESSEVSRLSQRLAAQQQEREPDLLTRIRTAGDALAECAAELAVREMLGTPPPEAAQAPELDLARLTCAACNAGPNMIGPIHTCEPVQAPEPDHVREARALLKANYRYTPESLHYKRAFFNGGGYGSSFQAAPEKVLEALRELQEGDHE